ncbi:hypothetical protein M406DRAFT_254320 [Cryphonectria parasitica EP155]|uniref:Myb-like domain-containing protein n=1 Tax=Cryphonectria parasitica (strain ATCC 38755 / EP155) TaxID=660469 RepID=A0A9P5CQX7_CRYP1|nr:uncharacterized protein M406DRAFT_254320 [Cryphonectria parasitica EP155]KAF3767658.1 hypothetical protein M406DRAFT_254320 [Cryphonectria parasitica EP155]
MRPMKKAKASHIHEYLSLLNEDIKHAAYQYVSKDREQFDERIALPASQIGMTTWTSMEKERFFESLGRLGRDDAAGIAQRIRSKGEMEVRQYMKLLQDGLAARRQQNELDPLELADFPAALELSQGCCEALEELADKIAKRQGNSEDASEEREHGQGWLIYQGSHFDTADKEAETDIPKLTRVLRVSEWLALSERFFMNAPTEEGNWQSVNGGLPSLRRTALEDYFSLALMLTKRLVSATLYMAASRIRSERGYRPETRDFVKKKDVQAAALSLGLAMQKPPLTRCVRRLGLSVYEDPPRPDEDDGEREPISHDIVEDDLGVGEQQGIGRIRHYMESIALSSGESSISSDSPAAGSSSEEDEHPDDSSQEQTDSEEKEEIRYEAEEAILYSAVDSVQHKRAGQALLRRIKAERAAERYADSVDAQASYQEEKRMWTILGKQPSEMTIDPGLPPSGRRQKISVDAGYSVGKDWRDKTKIISEWEARYEGL